MRDRGIEWRKARRALEALLDDPEQTQRVFELTAALAGRQPERLLARVRRSAEGSRLLRERPRVDSGSCDLDELMSLPHGTFGHEFARWMREQSLTPGLVDSPRGGEEPDVEYLGRRLAQVHDFWHVLSGYNRDPIGELGVLAFTFAQTSSRGIGLILLTVAWRSVVSRWRSERVLGSPLVSYLWRGWRRGRRARFLPALRLEDDLSLPLDSVRQRLGIEPLPSAFDGAALPPIAAPAPG